MKTVWTVWDYVSHAEPTRWGEFRSPQAAMAATCWPDTSMWVRSGSGWILQDRILDHMNATLSPAVIDIFTPPVADRDGDKITLTVTFSGSATQEFDRTEFEAAKASGEIAAFLDCWLSSVQAEETVRDPGGAVVEVRW